MKKINELNKAKKIAKKRAAKKLTPIFDDVIIKVDNRETPKVNYIRDALIFIGAILFIGLVAFLATLESGTLSTCYQIWKAV